MIKSKKAIYSSSLALFALSYSGTGAFAQQTEHANLAENQKKTKTVVSDNGPVIRSGVSESGESEGNKDGKISIPLLQILNEGDKVNGVFNLAYTRDGPLDSGASYDNYSDNFSLKVKIPISKKDKNSAFDIKGLGNGSTATLSYSKYLVDFPDYGLDKHKSAVSKAISSCIQKSSLTTTAKSNLLLFLKNRLALPANLNNKKEELERLALGPPGTDAGLVSAAQSLPCRNVDGKPFSEFQAIKQFAPGEYQKVVDAMGKNLNPTIYFGVDATLGYDKFDFLDRANFNVSDSGKFSYDGTVFAGIIGKRANWSGRVSASYARGFESPEKAEICRAITGTMDQECISGPDGRPVKKENAYLSGELRVLFPIGKKPEIGQEDKRSKFAIAPEFTWDIDEGEWAIDVPVYLQRNKKGILDGGIRLGYRSDRDDFAVGFFVGVPFGGILPN